MERRRTGIYGWKTIGMAVLDVRPLHVLDLEGLGLSKETLNKILEEAKKDGWDIIYYE